MKSGDVTNQSFSEKKTVNMFLKLALLCSVLSCARAAPASTDDVVPLEKQQPTVIPIVSQSEELESNGTFKFSYETGNGIKREEISYEKIIPKARSAGSEEGGENDESSEIHVQQGSYSYVAPDGTVISLKYIADENGFRPVGDHIPRAPVLVPGGDKSGRALKLDTKKAELVNVSPASAKSEPEHETPKEVASQTLSAPASKTSPVALEDKSEATPAPVAEDTKAIPKAAAPVEIATTTVATSKAAGPEPTVSASIAPSETASSTTAVSSAEVSSSAETASTTSASALKADAEVSSPKINSEEQSVSTESGTRSIGDISTESANLTTNSS